MRTVPGSLADAEVVVVGAGGLGCPAAWALAAAGVGRVTIVDPDRVEPSNLPRQVLFGPDDVGRPKALAAARRLDPDGARVHGVAERLDDTNEMRVLAGASVVIDATDGAPAKDWLNAVAVRRGLPLVHAAALRSEGRVLEVPPGGRPCLACLFGRLREEGGACADLGVWPGVVGATGYLAAAAAVRRVRAPDAPSPGYLLLDRGGGRTVVLTAAPDSSCLVCARGEAPPEPYPSVPACAVDPLAGTAPLDGEARLDLRDESCPLNLLRARRAVEDLAPGRVVRIVLGAEGRESVPEGLRALGHRLVDVEARADGLELVVARGRTDAGPGPGTRLSRDQLLRYARQVVLPEVGEAGQRRLLDAAVGLSGSGPLLEAAAVHLAASGVGRLVIDGEGAPPRNGFPYGRGRTAAEALAAFLSPRSDGRVEAGPLRGDLLVVRADDAVPGTEGLDLLAPGAGADRDARLRARGALLADGAMRAVVGAAYAGRP